MAWVLYDISKIIDSQIKFSSITTMKSIATVFCQERHRKAELIG
jgi:hypothetical protein